MNRRAKGLPALRMTNSVVHKDSLHWDSRSVTYILIEEVVPHIEELGLPGIVATSDTLTTTWTPFSFFSQWPPFKGTSSSNMHDALCQEQRASPHLPPATGEIRTGEEIRLYLTVSFLKVGLCFIKPDGWGRNVHPHPHFCHGAIPTEYAQDYSLRVERIPPPGRESEPWCAFSFPSHTLSISIGIQSASYTTERPTPSTGGWASPVGPFPMLCPTCCVPPAVSQPTLHACPPHAPGFFTVLRHAVDQLNYFGLFILDLKIELVLPEII